MENFTCFFLVFILILLMVYQYQGLHKWSLLNCAPSRLRTLPIIDTPLTRLLHHLYAPLLLSISTLIPFFLCRVVLFQLKDEVPMFCVCASINHSPPVSLFSLLFYRIKLFYMFFSSFYFKPLVTPLFIQLFCNNIFTFFCSVFHLK